MFKKLILFILFVINSSLAYTQTICYSYDPSTNFNKRIVNYKHIEATLKFEPKLYKTIGDVTFTFSKLSEKNSELVFYAPNFKIESITIEGRDSEYNFEGNNLIIQNPNKLEDGRDYKLNLKYEVQTYQGEIYFIGWNDPTNRRLKQIWAHRPHGWLPYADSRLTMDFKIIFDTSFKVFTNGKRISITNNNDGTNTWHYVLDNIHPFFSTSIVIGKMDWITLKSKSGVEEELWFYEWERHKVETTYQYSTVMIDFMEEELSVPYPYALYKQAPIADYQYGGMETTTATVFGDYMFIDQGAYWQRNYINVNIHELVHQWFGDAITHISGSNVFLTESFATYYAKLFERKIFGQDYYDWERTKEMEKIFQASKRDNLPVASSISGVERIYQKGSYVLDMLRDEVGESDFKKAITLYTKRHLYGETSIYDLQKAFYDITGNDYDWFFEQWFRRGGEPSLQISYQQIEKNGQKFTQVGVEQVQEINELVKLFRINTKIEVYYTDGTSTTFQVNLKDKFHLFEFPNPVGKELDFIVFDPNYRILKKIVYLHEIEQTIKQALKAKHLIDRYYALKSLENVEWNKKKDILQKIYYNEKYHLLKAEVIRQIKDNLDDISLKILRDACLDQEPLIVQTVVENIRKVPLVIKREYESILNNISYKNVELALENLCLSFPKETSKYLKITANKEDWRGRNIRMKWLELSYLNGNKSVLKEIIDYSSISFDFETRLNALMLLQKINYLDREVARNLMLAAIHWNPKLYRPAKEIMDYFLKQMNYKEIIHKTFNNSDFMGWEKDKISKLIWD